MNIIILAGGSGTRLWPMSRKKKAKQFNKIVNQATMLENTLDRFKDDYKKENIYISTNLESYDNVLKVVPDFPKDNIIIEPEKRDTAAAMGYVCAFMSIEHPDEPLAFIPSDHYIKDPVKFLASIKAAEGKILSTKKLVDIGITPESPSTALGYTWIGKKVDDVNGIAIYEFLGHKEKPELELAKQYFESGEYLWHANFYMWTPRLFLEAFKKYAPDIYAPLEDIIGLLKTKDYEKVAEVYAKIPKTMIDYAVTEKMDPKDILIIKGEFGWSDIGSWDVLHKKLDSNADDKGNLVKGQWVGIDTAKSLIYAEGKKLVATVGIEDMIIVDTKDALLICPKDRCQDVKKLVELIQKSDTLKDCA